MTLRIGGGADAAGACPMTPYYSDDSVTLYLGDCREIVPAVGITGDLVCTDPPYQCTSLEWDRWVDGWPTLAATVASSMWCFGSMRMFLDRSTEFAGWRMSQDVVWRRNTGSGMQTDRFRRVHESAIHWYRGAWSSVHHATPRHVPPGGTRGHVAVGSRVDRVARSAHLGHISDMQPWTDDGTRLRESVIEAKNLRGLAIHPTEKPVLLLRPLIEYACPPGGTVVDLFAGSGSTLDAARQTGRLAIGIEADEAYLERAAQRLSQQLLFTGEGP